MKSQLESLASDMNLATTAIMEAKEGLFGIIKVNNEHDERIGNLTECLTYGGEQLCNVIAEKVEVLFAAIPEIKELAEQQPKQDGSSTGNSVSDKLYLKLDRLISVCDLGSSDFELDSINPQRLSSLFYLCLELALECKDHLDEITGIKEVA